MLLLVRYLLLLFAAVICCTHSYSQPSSHNTPAYTHVFRHHECTPEAYELALKGYHILLPDSFLANPRYLTIVDYTKPSQLHRLFVIDMQKHRLARSSIVAHGKGSDPDSTTIPYRFSNRDGSHATSLGFYLTGNTYTNHRPSDSLGLCLFGLDSGYNDAAAAREIVVHYGATEYKGAVYVTDTGAGRSSGCPALPLSTNMGIIRMIQGGSLLFLYSDKDRKYATTSTVLTGRLRGPVVQHGPPPNNCTCQVKGRQRK